MITMLNWQVHIYLVLGQNYQPGDHDVDCIAYAGIMVEFGNLTSMENQHQQFQQDIAL